MPTMDLPLLPLVLLSLISLCTGCPPSCSCKWKNGKQTVECLNKDLLIIPDGMDSGTQVLEFCGNNLQTLHLEKFLKMDLINLQRIYLCRCRIASVHDRTFKGLTNLVELDLSGNFLEAVPSPTFLDCPSLMRLSLSGNPIKTLRKNAFNHLASLTNLELSRCAIAKIEGGAFQGLYRLEWLYLNGNKMTSILDPQLPETLKGIHLQDNPWECDCHLQHLHTWLQNFPIPLSVDPICTGPKRLQDLTIKSIPPQDLACLPEVSPTVFFLEISEGKNLSLLCQVRSIPDAHISWTFRGQLLQNDTLVAPGLRLLYFFEDGSLEKRSELFIYNANSEDNGTFVCKAENPAGAAQANFTIRIVVKQEPVAEVTELPVEFVMMVTMAAAACSVLLLLLLMVSCVTRCRGSRDSTARKKKRDNSIKIAVNSAKDNLIVESEEDSQKRELDVEEAAETVLFSGSVQPIHHLHHHHTEPISSPISIMRTYHQLEQNPDLINGTENASLKLLDMRLNPIELLNPTEEIHPSCRNRAATAATFNCYKTLPYNRAGSKKSNAATPMGRYSREAEFLSRVTTQSYEHYNNYGAGDNVRYTADGYPVKATPGGGGGDACCSSSGVKINWPSCLPGNLNSGCNNSKNSSSDNIVKSVGSQTNGSVQSSEEINSKSRVIVGESLDEGYEDLSPQHSGFKKSEGTSTTS